jgi:hypothetical protein
MHTYWCLLIGLGFESREWIGSKMFSNWHAVEDPENPGLGLFYFWDPETGEAMWDLPDGLEEPTTAGPIRYNDVDVFPRWLYMQVLLM